MYTILEFIKEESFEMKNFFEMDRAEITNFIFKTKKKLGNNLTVFAHNFTEDDLLPFADVIGDTSNIVKGILKSKSKYLLFASAKFFTEAAAILVPDRTIIQANMKANCPLTYIIDEKATRTAFSIIQQKNSKQVIPMAYFTASIQLKSFCGENKGTVCTASNAVQMIDYYLQQNKAIFFTPMNNIAFNALKTLNIPEKDIFVLDEHSNLNLIPPNKKMYIWNTGCSVHSGFTATDIKRVRNKYKKDNIQIIAHLECLPDVIAECDFAEFTDGMKKRLEEASAGTCWGLATTNNFVIRMANKYRDKKIVSIRPDLLCKDMVITDLPHVAKSLQSILDFEKGKGELKYKIEIPDFFQISAKKAINTMFKINKEINVVDEVVNF